MSALIVHRGDAEGKLSLVAGGVVVCILEIDGDREATDRGLTAIAANLPEDVPVLPIAESDCGEVLASLTPADVVLLTAACRPSGGWLARLRDAATADEMIGTASPLGGQLIGALGDLRPDAVAEMAEGSRPRLRTGGPDCLYVRREALALVRIPGQGSRVITGLADEVAATGMLNVLADDVLVPTVTTSGSPREPSFDEGSPVQHAVRLARISQRALSVTLDGRSLNRIGGGTQRYVLELVLALDRVGAGTVSLRVVLPPDPPAAVLAELDARPRIETIRYEQALGGVPRTDVVHRPQQVFSVDDLNLVRLLGDRLVITHQDLIGYHNGAYHSRPEYWQRYRQATRLALAAADRTIFFSEVARRDALAEGLVDVARTDVIGIALDEPFPEAARAPAGMRASDDFIVCLGADYRHKNRPFALAVLAALRGHHGFGGRLVFAGGHVDHGSSSEIERAYLDEHPDLVTSVTDLGAIAEPERAWLLQNARAVMVPSVVEGFGLMPLEAAAAGVPCLFAARSSLREVVSEELATLVCWDPGASAEAAAELLGDGAARDAHVRRLREDATRWSWDDLAPRLLGTYEQTVHTPMAPATGLVWRTIDDELAMADERAVHQELLDHLRGRAALARDDGFFTEEELRGLWRVGSRPAVKRGLLAPVRLIGRPRGRG